MRNQTANSNSSHLPNNTYEPIERVLYRLKELHQIEDESRNQLCPVFSDEESNRQSRRQSKWSQKQQNHQVLKDLQQTEGVQSRQHLGSRNSTFKSNSNSQDLKTANTKLRQDNVKLFQECIKLKKQLQLYEAEVSGFQKKVQEEEIQRIREQQQKLERVTRQLDMANRQVELLVRNKQELQKDLELEKKARSQQKQQVRMRAFELDELNQQLSEMKKVNRQLKARATQLEKQLEEEQLRRASKSNSLNTTSQQSKKDSDKDRMISNLKLVHESQIRKLKGVIQQLKKQTTRQRQ